MPATAAALPAYCPNCAAAVHGPYCAQCGQETAIGVPTLREFGHEYLHTFVTLEGRLWKTLWLLIRWPGKLTTEFLAGRRRRYVRPLPLYLSLSFLFFLAFTFSPPEMEQFIEKENAGAVPRTNASGPEASSELDFKLDTDAPKWAVSLLQQYREAFKRLSANPKASGRALATAFFAKLPIAVFFMVPLFALLTFALYRKRRRTYTEHLLFALHLHAFVFLCLLLGSMFLGLATGFLLLIWWLYLGLALRTVFSGRLWPQLLRSFGLLLSYWVLLVVQLFMVLVLVFPSV